MKEQKYHIYLTNQERSEIIESLIDFKNLRMQQGKYTDAVDEVLVKVIRAKKKKLKAIQQMTLKLRTVQTCPSDLGDSYDRNSRDTCQMVI